MAKVSAHPSIVAGDFTGGLAAAVVSITGNVAAGVIAFAPLGSEFVTQGILAGMLSSIVAGLLAAISGSAPGMISGPKATTAMVFAALLSQLLATGRFDLAVEAEAQVLRSLAFSAVLVSGSVQVLLGAFRVGGLVKFMPYPVVAGIRNTTAILLIFGQMWPFMGAELREITSFAVVLPQMRPASLAVGMITAVVALRGGRYLPKPLVPVCALVAGTALHHLIASVLPGARLGAVLGNIEPAIPTPAYLSGIVSAVGNNLDLVGAVIAGAFAMAVLDAVSALITLVSYQSIADRRFDANKQLVGQGLGTAVVSVFGGLTSSGILARAAVNHGAGGRTRVSGVVTAVGVFALVVLLARPLGWIPKASIAGLILVIAAGLFDRWTVGQLREGLRFEAENPRDNLAAVGLMGVVVGVGVSVNLVAAVGVGVGLSVLVFVIQMSRSPIRRVRTGATVRSARERDDHLSAVLAEHGDRIGVLELEGALFFGSSDALATRAEDLVEEGADFVLLDLRRVSGIDATGYKILGQTFSRLKSRDAMLAFSHVLPGQLNSEIAEDLVQSGIPETRMFETVDQALEFFEEKLLSRLDAEAANPLPWSIERFGEGWGLSAEECATLEPFLVALSLKEGEFVFREGDEGRSLYLLASGLADVSIPIGDDRRRRLASFQQGTVFGEMALLDGSPRAAGISAGRSLELFELSYEAFERLTRDEPEIALKIQIALGRILGARLRGANALIWELDS